jgi:hypothetical protein
VGKLGLFGVLLLLFGTVRLYGLDWEHVQIPLVSGGGAVAAAPASVQAIGKPAEVKLPEIDFKKWFQADAVDPYDPQVWAAVDAFYAVAGTKDGWVAACKAASAGAGKERPAAGDIGALGCSDSPAVTLVQQFQVSILGARAEVALWVRGVPGHGTAGIEGRQGEIRLACRNDVIAREGGAASPYAAACAKALDAGWKTGDGPATFTALGEAYKLVAAEIAKRDPTIDPEPAFYGAEVKKP